MPRQPESNAPEAFDQNATLHLLWDWPTRILHWVMAGLFLGAFAIAVLTSKHSPAFLIHAALGLLLAVAVVLRLAWGMIGSRPSRFGSFMYSPLDLIRYVWDAIRGADKPTAGHNPGSSYAIYALLLLPLGLAATGIARGRGMEWAEEVHEVLAYTLLAVIVLHLLGLVWHTLRHREAIALSMIHGYRKIPIVASIPSAQPLPALAFILVMGASAVVFWQALDFQKRTITLPGIRSPLSLGAKEAGDPQLQHQEHVEDD